MMSPFFRVCPAGGLLCQRLMTSEAQVIHAFEREG